MKLTIIIGCFNEKLTILKAIQEAKVLKIDKEIIVIDNCSTDGTKEILDGLKDDKTLKIILHSKNMGAGYSGWEGICLAQGDYVYGPGADLEYKMEDALKMIDKMENEGLDVVFGSRLLGRVNTSNIELIKERPFWLGTIIATFFINLLYGKHFTDIIGTNLIKINVLKKLNCKASSQAFAFELVSKLCKGGYKTGEIPVYYKPRTHKEGKTVKATDMIPALWTILKVKFWLGKNA
ncbi:MAG: glycosyltransferase family 2 protein [Candidatus Omnitrophota bacterium]|nr:glycosyltransferase family 2 protein [Candidatus Omnitrophota bacterium]